MQITKKPAVQNRKPPAVLPVFLYRNCRTKCRTTVFS
nr:MAG TPA: hypothetical protein [Caudoviricetes sp.]